MRLAIAIVLGRLAGALSRLTGGGATSLPGVVALKVEPRLIEKLSAELAATVVVTGTNGKTTTSRFIGAVLEQEKVPYLHNQAGSNLLRGVAASLLLHRPPKARRHETVGLFEIDEATMPDACRRLRPRIVAVTNLFRDQLDRYGELKRTADYLRTGLAILPPDSTVVLNADDPLVASLGRDLPQTVQCFGINDESAGGTELPHAADSLTAPDGSLLEYSRVYVGHLGHYRAPDFARPAPEVAATRITLDGLRGSTTEVATPDGTATLQLGLPGLYNVYNALAALAVGLAQHAKLPTIAQALEQSAAAFGRLETVAVGDRHVLIGLIKNPTGANELINTLALTPEPKDFLILINDNFADGRDISWLWDADFEKLLPSARSVTVSGTRSADMAVRLKYAGLPVEQINVEKSLDAALKAALQTTPAGQTLYVLPTYTAMLELRQQLAKAGHLAHFLR